MSDPERLLESETTQIEALLLRSGRGPAAPEGAEERLLASMAEQGLLTATVMSQVSSATAMGSAKAGATASASVLKWVTMGGIAGAVASAIGLTLFPMKDNGEALKASPTAAVAASALRAPTSPSTSEVQDPETPQAPAPAVTSVPWSSLGPQVKKTDSLGPQSQKAERRELYNAAPPEVTSAARFEAGPRVASSEMPGGANALSQPLAPSAPSLPTPVPSLAAETALMDYARDNLRMGEGQRTLAALDDYSRKFPAGVFLIEALAMRIEAFALLGDRSTATLLAQQFLKAQPRSPHAQRVRVLLGLLHESPPSP